VKWRTGGCGKAGTKLAVSGGYLVNDLTCHRIDGERAAKLWTLEGKHAGGEFSPVIYDGRFYSFVNEGGEKNVKGNRRRRRPVDRLVRSFFSQRHKDTEKS